MYTYPVVYIYIYIYILYIYIYSLSIDVYISGRVTIISVLLCVWFLYQPMVIY